MNKEFQFERYILEELAKEDILTSDEVIEILQELEMEKLREEGVDYECA